VVAIAATREIRAAVVKKVTRVIWPIHNKAVTSVEARETVARIVKIKIPVTVTKTKVTAEETVKQTKRLVVPGVLIYYH